MSARNEAAAKEIAKINNNTKAALAALVINVFLFKFRSDLVGLKSFYSIENRISNLPLRIQSKQQAES